MNKLKPFHLICFGLLVTPFYFSRTLELQSAKMFVSALCATSIFFACTLCSYFNFKNKWLAALTIYLILFSFAYPAFTWTAIPTLSFLAFALMFSAVSFTKFEVDEVKLIYAVICTAGVVMAIYCIFQSIGAEQLFKPTELADNRSIIQPMVTGFFGTNTVAAAFLVICLPFAIYLGSFTSSVLIISGIVAACSRTAYLAAALVLFLCWCAKQKQDVVLFIIRLVAVAFMLFLFISYAYLCDKTLIEAHGRWHVWQEAWKSMFLPMFGAGKYTYTGTGLGGFRFIYQNLNFQYADNEYLEWFTSTGIVGVGLAAMTIREFLSQVRMTEQSAPVVISLVAMAFCAFWLYILHVGTFDFYLAALAGLLVSLSCVKTDKEDFDAAFHRGTH